MVDRIVELIPRERVRAWKNVTATDAAAASINGGMPHLPGAMLLESMAQAAGLLVIASLTERAQPVLAKVQSFGMTVPPRSGDRIEIGATLDDLRPEGARLRVTADVDGRRIASAVVFLALIPIDGGEQRQRLASRLAVLFPEWFAPLIEATP